MSFGVKGLKRAGCLMHQQIEYARTVYSANTVFISEQTTTFALDNINILVFITDTKSLNLPQNCCSLRAQLLPVTAH
jgi:hypothetical protein